MEKKQNCVPVKGHGKYLVAVLFIIAGVLLMARNMGWITDTVFHTIVSWQMLLIVLGLYMMIRRVFIQGLILLAIGTFFIAPYLDWLPANTNVILFPVVLIVIGLTFIFKPKRARCEHHRMKNFAAEDYNSADGFLRSENTFSGIKQVVLDEIFKGATIQNTFGGTAIDLRRTAIPEGETYIDVDCTFGGIEIYVPSEWKVVFQCNSCLGGCEDKRFGGGIIDQSRVLIIRGSVTFGGIEIKS